MKIKQTYFITLNNVSTTAIRSANLSRRHPLIVIVTVINTVFVLAAAAVVQTLVVVVVVCGSDVIQLPTPVPGLTIEKWMSTGGWPRGFISALSLILA